MLSYQERTKVLFYMGVPTQGVNMIGFALGARYNQLVGNLYERLNDLQSYEEVMITGKPVAALRVFGTPAVGDPISATVTLLNGANPQPTVTATYDVTAQDVANPLLALYAAATGLAIALTRASNGTVGIMASAGPDPGFAKYAPKVAPPFAEVALQGTSATPFSVTTNFTGATMISPLTQGDPSEPHLDVTSPAATTLNGFLPILDHLYAQIGTAEKYAAYAKAETVQFRPEEAALRNALFKFYRKGLSQFLGIPLFPMGRAPRAPLDT